MSRHIALHHQTRRIAACIGAIVAVGCGGGGGGEGEAPPPPELLQITTQNQAAVARATAMSFGTLDSFRDILAYSVPAGTQASAAAGLTKHALGKGMVAVRSTGAIVRPQEVRSYNQPCQSGGSITVTFDDRDNSGTPSSGDSLTLVFNDCREDTSLMRGSLGVSLASYSASQITGQFTINQLAVSDETGSAVANGVASFDFASSTDASGVLTERLNMTVGAAGLSANLSTPKIQEAVTYDPGFRAQFSDVWFPNQPGYDEAALYGKVSLASIGGKISLNTISPMHDSWVEDYPNSGKVTVDGHLSHLHLTATNSTTVRLELDHNDDGAIEVTSEMGWGELLPF